MAEITLDSKAFKHNLNLIKSHITDTCELALVLKDNAYGHGLTQMAQLAKENGIKSVFVKNYNEAMMIKDDFANITALYGTPSGDYPPNIAFVINDTSHIKALKPKTKVELKVNAGMNRNGIELSELESYIKAILDSKLELFGIFTHNGYGDYADSGFEATMANFKSIKQKVLELAQKFSFKPPRFHSLSTSGAIRVGKDIDDSLVRIGIGAYGYLDVAFSNDIGKKLQKVLALYADRVATRVLKKGARIGYGGATTLESDSIISTYDVGYGDGLFRIDSSRMLKTAKGYDILPNTSMDCFSALSDDERICVFSDANVFAKAFNTISYEVLAHLSPTILRTII